MNFLLSLSHTKLTLQLLILIIYSSIYLLNLNVLRLKDLAQEQYSQNEADFGAGKRKEVLPSMREKRLAAAQAADAQMQM